MVRPPFIDCNGMKKGAWSEEEDNKLRAYVLKYGHWNWRLLPKYAGLARCGKSCRLRWVNYLKPGVKRGNFTKDEEDLIIKLHSQLGNKWSAIATKLPGRTDNEIKNLYHTRIQKRPKEKPSPNKVKHHVSSSEASSSKEGETALDNNTSPHVITPPQVDTLPDIFKIDTNNNQMESFPLLTDDEFDYVPQLHYSQLSTSNSSYMDPLDWIGDDDRSNISYPFVDPSAQGCLWSEESSASNYQNGRADDFCDPLFGQCFDYGGMGLFS